MLTEIELSYFEQGYLLPKGFTWEMVAERAPTGASIRSSRPWPLCRDRSDGAFLTSMVGH